MPTSARSFRTAVDPPQRQPMPYGLFTAVENRENTGDHWKAGVEWQPLCGGSSTTLDFCVTGSAWPAKVDTGGRDLRGATPFTVYAEVDCSTPGNWGVYDQDAVKLLDLTEQWSVERSFWTGVAAGASDRVLPHLADDTAILEPIAGTALSVSLQTAATVVSGSSAISITQGIGAIEKALADCYDGVAVLHVPVNAVPAMTNAGILRVVGSHLETHNGNRVVAGAGYPGTSPSGAAPAAGTTWIYATGAMFMYRGPVRSFQRETSLDRSTNTLKMIAERTYLLGWDCCHFAVLVNL